MKIYKLIFLIGLTLSFSSFAGSLFVVSGTSTTQRIHILGNIDDNLNREFKYFSSHNVSREKETRLILDNGGGLLFQGLQTADLIIAMSREIQNYTRKPVDIRVESNCHSMCILLFRQLADAFERGEDSITIKVKKAALFGFHAAHDSGRRNAFATDLYVSHLRGTGVNQGWLNTYSRIFTSTRLTYFEGKTLVDTDSGVVRGEYLY